MMIDSKSLKSEFFDKKHSVIFTFTGKLIKSISLFFTKKTYFKKLLVFTVV